MKGKVKIIAIFLVLALLFSIFASTMKVYAFANTNKITITFRDGYDATQGKVQYSVDDGANWVDVTANISNQSITMAGDNLRIRIVPASGYGVDFAGIAYQEDEEAVINLNTDTTGVAGGLTGSNGYYVDASAHSVTLSNVEFRIQEENEGEGEPINVEEITSINFTINGQYIPLTINNGDAVANVPQNMNFDDLDELYITQIVVRNNETNVETTYNYEANEYSLDLLDTENRTILETHLTKQTSNLAFLRIQAHAGDIQDSDLTRLGKTIEDFYEFYLPQIVLVKPGLSGLVEVGTEHMPNVYDFVSFNGIELSDTSENNFGEVTVYYGDNTIDLSGLACEITDIQLVEGKGVLASAVDIDVENKKVTVKSNYYNNIPLKITAINPDESVVVGYINVVRVGIYINDLNKGATVFFHGAFNGKVNDNGGNLNVDTDKHRMVAVFYHDKTTTVNDFDLVVNIVNKDGTTETKLAKPVGDVDDEGEDPLVGSDYIIWEGDSIEDRPSRIYVTAVKKGATSNSTAFGGATFGAGAGVTWINEE